MRLVVLISMIFISSNALPPPPDKLVGLDEGGEEPAVEPTTEEIIQYTKTIEELIHSYIEETTTEEPPPPSISTEEPILDMKKPFWTEEPMTEEPMTEQPHSTIGTTTTTTSTMDVYHGPWMYTTSSRPWMYGSGSTGSTWPIHGAGSTGSTWPIHGPGSTGSTWPIHGPGSTTAEVETAEIETEKDDSDGVQLHFYLSEKEDAKTSSKEDVKISGEEYGQDYEKN